MVSFFASIIVGTIVLVGPFMWMMKKKPVDWKMTWGEAMVVSAWAFMLMFWWYGVVPNQWLLWADNELQWRSDKLMVGARLFGDQGIVEQALPLTINYVHIRDVLAVLIYVVGLGANMALWKSWQARGDRKPSTDVVSSEYGRPLVKPAGR